MTKSKCKLLAVLLAAALLLAGCHMHDIGEQKVDPNNESVQIGMTHTDIVGIELQIVNAVWDETGTTLEVKWINNTDNSASYDEGYWIERKTDDGWTACDIDGISISTILHDLAANSDTTRSYQISQFFDVSVPGTYRFKANCEVNNKSSGGSTSCSLWAEFTVSNDEAKVDPSLSPEKLKYGVQYIRTNGYHEGAQFPAVAVIKSVEALNSYYQANKDIYYLERREQVYSDSTIGFLDACDAYDAAFFEDSYLVFVLLEEGSGSNRHEVTGVEMTAEKQIAISVNTVTPEVGTDDMAQWHIILELSRDAEVSDQRDVQVYWNGKLRYGNGVGMEEPGLVPTGLTKPLEGTLITPDGEAALRMGGYSWSYTNNGAITEAAIACQGSRPLEKKFLTPVTVSAEKADTVYAYVPESGKYAPTNSRGYFVKLDFDAAPTAVTYTCWPDTVWQNSSTPAEEVVSYDDMAFYAKPGGYIYEIAATWEDTGAGYYGTANYYVYIIGGEAHNHQVAAEAQTVDDPFIGYCGNTQTTLHIDRKAYTFMAGPSVTLTDILLNLDYRQEKLCRCSCEYTVDTEFGTGYGISLSQGYARCEKGQADLTQEQINQISKIIEWAKTQTPDP